MCSQADLGLCGPRICTTPRDTMGLRGSTQGNNYLEYLLLIKQRLILKDDGVIALTVDYYFKTIVKVRSQQKYLIYNTNQPPILLYKAKRLH